VGAELAFRDYLGISHNAPRACIGQALIRKVLHSGGE
jgi:hypothetical protein